MLNRDLKLDATGDFEVLAGDLTLVADDAAIGQSANIRLQFFEGEWFLDLDAGIPFFQSVLIKNPDPNVLQTVFREALLETPGVTSLESLTLTFDRSLRKLTVAFQVNASAALLSASVQL